MSDIAAIIRRHIDDLAAGNVSARDKPSALHFGMIGMALDRITALEEEVAAKAQRAEGGRFVPKLKELACILGVVTVDFDTMETEPCQWCYERDAAIGLPEGT